MAVEEWSAGPFPADTVAAVRRSLGDLVENTINAVRAESRTYEEVLSGPSGLGIRIGIEQAIRAFLDALERGERPDVDAAEIWRRLGEAEYQEGRDLDDLRSAFRTGTRAVWRSASKIASDAGVGAEQVIALAEAVFVYTDELAADVVEGYLQAKSDEAGERERRRRRLVGLLMDAASQQPEVIERAADLARWPLPRKLGALAFDGEIPLGVPRRIGVQALAGADATGGWLLLPDPDGPGQTAALKRGLNGVAAALGPTVGTYQARRSLRLARLTLALVHSGILPGGTPVRSGDHLSALIVHQDPELAGELATARLNPLDTVPAADRARLLETLDAWLRHQRHTPRIAAELHVHPQTVRYRLATLRELLGETIDTPQGRFELELALRARQGSSEVR